MVAKKNPHQRFKKGQEQLISRFAKNSGKITPTTAFRAAIEMARVGWAAEAIQKATGVDLIETLLSDELPPSLQHLEQPPPNIVPLSGFSDNPYLAQSDKALFDNPRKNYARGGRVRKPNKR